jgi:hypothetical protein
VSPGRDSRRFNATLLVTAAVAGVLLVSRRDYVPMWDGWFYAQCIVEVAARHMALETLRCAEHLSYSSMVFAGFFQLFSPDGFGAMLFASAVLYALACLGFERIARIAFPGAAHQLDRALLTSAFALNPALLASVLQPNIDLPMLPAFLWGIVFILRRRWVALVLTGVALVLAKESGVLLYATLLFAFALAVVLPAPSSSRSPLRAVARLLPLAVPIGVFAGYVAYRVIVPHAIVLSAAGTTDKSILYQFLVPRIDPYFVSYMAIITLLHFAWITTMVIVADAAVGLKRKVAHASRRQLPGSKRLVVRFLTVLGVLTIYALTRYSSYANTRYLLPVFALLPLLLYAAVVRLGIPPGVRRPFLAVLAVIAALSTVRSIDPVSRALFGTFPFGDRSMLRMTRLTRECCGAGQDQLANSLQFSVLSDLTSDLTSTLVDDSTTIIVPPRMTWEPVGRLDSRTRRRTLRTSGSFAPAVVGADSLAKLDELPRNAVYLALPNGDVAAGMNLLEAWYEAGPAVTARRGGYSMTGYRLAPRRIRPTS